jgi:phage repressor protein C with HTH and peptisase S24 domain
MKELGISQAELARRVKISQPSVSAIINGDTRSPKHLRAIALVLETTEAWLLAETEDRAAGSVTALDRESMADRLGLHLVPEVDAGWAMGEGSFLDVIEQTGFRAFDREWLRSISAGNVSLLFVAHGDGDSMEPTLHDGDVVLIDQAQRAIERQDRIWAVTVGGLGMIKRIAKLPNGDFELASDNHRVRSRTVTADEFHVVGRVVWIGRKI